MNKNRRNYLYYLWWLGIVADYKTDDRQQFIVEGLLVTLDRPDAVMSEKSVLKT